MLLAIIVLYQIAEGSRHMLVFLISFIIVGVMRDDRTFEKNIIVLAVFAYLFIVKYDDGWSGILSMAKQEKYHGAYYFLYLRALG